MLQKGGPVYVIPAYDLRAWKAVYKLGTRNCLLIGSKSQILGILWFVSTQIQTVRWNKIAQDRHVCSHRQKHTFVYVLSLLCVTRTSSYQALVKPYTSNLITSSSRYIFKQIKLHFVTSADKNNLARCVSVARSRNINFETYSKMLIFEMCTGEACTRPNNDYFDIILCEKVPCLRSKLFIFNAKFRVCVP